MTRNRATHASRDGGDIDAQGAAAELFSSIPWVSHADIAERPRPHEHARSRGRWTRAYRASPAGPTRSCRWSTTSCGGSPTPGWPSRPPGRLSSPPHWSTRRICVSSNPIPRSPGTVAATFLPRRRRRCAASSIENARRKRRLRHGGERRSASRPRPPRAGRRRSRT